jgi:hypothetical protein
MVRITGTPPPSSSEIYAVLIPAASETTVLARQSAPMPRSSGSSSAKVCGFTASTTVSAKSDASRRSAATRTPASRKGAYLPGSLSITQMSAAENAPLPIIPKISAEAMFPAPIKVVFIEMPSFL